MSDKLTVGMDSLRKQLAAADRLSASVKDLFTKYKFKLKLEQGLIGQDMTTTVIDLGQAVYDALDQYEQARRGNG